MSQQKKIAVLVINCLQGGGAERSVLTLGQGFYELGFDVHIVRFKPLVEYDLNPNLNYHLVRFKPYKLIPGETRRYKVFARVIDHYISDNIGKPNIVLSNLEHADRVMAHSQLPNIMYVIRNNIAHKYDLIDNPQNDSKVEKLKKIYNKHPCICISKGVEEVLQNYLGKQIVSKVIYNAFDKSEIETMANKPAKLLPQHIKPKQYLLHVGSFKHQKAHNVLIEAYAKSSMKYPLVLLGQGQLLEKMKVLTKTLNISDKVIFLGFDKNPYPYIFHATGLVLASNFEGFGRVILEAIALNTPAISTDCPSGPSELLPTKNLVAVGNSDALAVKIDEVMTYPNEFVTVFNEDFLPNRVAQQYIDYMNEQQS